MSTPRPWPENAEPTPEQLADWLAVSTRDERIAFSEQAIRNADAAFQCFIQCHANLLDEVEHLRGEFARLAEQRAAS